MSIRAITQVSLLTFAAAGFAAAIANVVGVGQTGAAPRVEAASAELRAPTDEPEWLAYFFHATHRCATCESIEAHAYEALLPEIDRQEITWRVADYTADENRELVERFEVGTSTVVLVHRAAGKIVRWKNLESEIWRRAGEREPMLKLLREAARAFRKES